MGIFACNCQGLSEECVTFTLTNSGGNRSVVGWVDSQDEGDDAVAAMGGLQCVIVSACFGVHLAVEVTGVAITHGIRNRRVVVGRINGQVESEDAVATVYCRQSVGVEARLGEHLSEEFVTVTLADSSNQRSGIDGVDREGHVHHGVAAVSSGKGGCFRAVAGESDTVPFVRKFTVANRLGVEDFVGLFDGQGHHNH